MRPLIHILRSVGYVTLLPYLAFARSESFATCMPNPGAAFAGFVLAGITFLIIMGYGNILETKNPRTADTTFWVSSIVFYAGISSLVIIRSHDGLLTSLMTNLVHFHDAFIPQYQPYLALDAVGGLTFLALAIWMPIASILSMIVFGNALYKRRLDVTKPA